MDHRKRFQLLVRFAAVLQRVSRLTRLQKGAIVAMSIFGLMAQEPHSLARVALVHAGQKDRMLTLADRVAYQYAIEEVYWRHRIWPKERTDSKPPHEAVTSSRQIDKKVRDYLRNSRVLENYWQQPISSQRLQAEMERMAKHT